MTAPVVERMGGIERRENCSRESSGIQMERLKYDKDTACGQEEKDSRSTWR